MAFKEFVLDEQISVTVYKRRATRNLRLSIAANGKVRVTIPSWAPYTTGLSFARARVAWIKEHQAPRGLVEGQPVGKAHHLRFIPSDASNKTAGRIAGNEIVITHPAALAPEDGEVQAMAERTAIRALRSQAQHLLPQRLEKLATEHDFSYNSVSIKHLKSRWGSCDHDGNIVLNLFLMQLPWAAIDYVLLHELTHTRILRHGPVFWQAMTDVLPDVPAIRKTMRTYQPVLDSPLGPETVA